MLLAGCFGEFDPDLSGFQPEEGVFSPCESSQDCSSDGACLGSSDMAVQLDDTWDGEGACTRWATGSDPDLECAPYPEGYATAEIAYGMDASGDRFCVLECAGGLKCPVGMDCIHVYSPAVMYEAEVCL
jgi:hypothetical protein